MARFNKQVLGGGGSMGVIHQSIQMLGVISALRTGNQIVDTILALAIPFLISAIIQHIRKEHGHLLKASFWRNTSLDDFWRRKYHRTIVYRSARSELGAPISVDEGSCNSYLIRAIKLFIHKHCDLDLDDADLELTDTENMIVKDNEDVNTTAISSHPGRGFGSGKMLPRDSPSQGSSSTSTASMLKSCAVVKKPVQQIWHPIGTFNGNVVQIWMREDTTTEEKSDDSGSKSMHTTEIKLRSIGKASTDAFVDRAYVWYMSELKKLETNDRYLLDLRGFDGRAHHRYPVFSRYTLSNEKTFDSLFSHQCHSLLKIVDQFQAKSGKYSVPGYPYKLGVLLHGPPGTGKTSLIKALAHYTGRHIVNVPLSRLATNQELASMFYGSSYAVAGKAQRLSLGVSQVIFVLEDVDASSKVVMRRDLSSPMPTAAAEIIEKAKEKKPMPIEQSDDEPPRQRGAFRRNNRPDGQASVAAVAAAAAASAVAAVPMRPPDDNNDELNLTGLLNVLDGTVEMPGRIVILTTNHPELLDPALIRPGRIDKHLELGYMSPGDTISMIEHYYQTNMDETEKSRIEKVMSNDSATPGRRLELVPAFIEQLSMEKETVEEMIGCLEEKYEQLFEGAKDNAISSASSVSSAGKSTESFDLVCGN